MSDPNSQSAAEFPKLTLTRHPTGAAAASGDPSELVLANFLEDDVQGSVKACDQILAAIAGVNVASAEPWSQTGNAHTIELSADGAVIAATAYEAKEYAISLAALKQVVKAWRAHVG